MHSFFNWLAFDLSIRFNPFMHCVENGQIYFKNLAVFTPQYFWSMRGHLSLLRMKPLQTNIYFSVIPENFENLWVSDIFEGIKTWTLAWNKLTLFTLMSHCYTPWKRLKTPGFLTFSGFREKGYWRKKG